MGNKYSLMIHINQENADPRRHKHETLGALDKIIYELGCLRNKYRHIPEEKFPEILRLGAEADVNKKTVLTETKKEQPSKDYLLEDFCEE